MKRLELFLTGLVVLMVTTSAQLRAQQEPTLSKFSVGADVYSNYIWRGNKIWKRTFQYNPL